jgi:hypothetical protein
VLGGSCLILFGAFFLSLWPWTLVHLARERTRGLSKVRVNKRGLVGGHSVLCYCPFSFCSASGWSATPG